MKRFLGLVVCAFIFVGIRSCIGCGSDSQSTGNGQQAATSQPDDTIPTRPSYSTLQVSDLDGNPKEIQLNPNTSVIYMATWCPHSKALKQMLQDSDMSQYLQGKTLAFVFGKQEWAQVKSELQDLVKSGEYTQEQASSALTKLENRESGSKFFDATFFDDLPGDVYVADLSDLAHGFPSARVGDRITGASVWMQRELRMPASAVVALYGKYDPPEKDGSNDNTSQDTGGSDGKN